MSIVAGCADTGCPREFPDGFCDLCGRPPQAAESLGGVSLNAPPGLPEGDTDYHPVSRLTREAVERSRSAARRAGAAAGRANWATVWPSPSSDPCSPLDLVMVDPQVPAHRLRCSSCGGAVAAEKRFCPACGTANSFTPALSTGEEVGGQYSVIGPIAYGGMGWIYLARDVRLDRFVVLKGLLNTADPAALAAAALERDFLSAIRHPLVVGIENHVAHGGHSYIVMEFVHGRTLRHLRRAREPMAAHEALGVMVPVLSALEHIHSKGLAYCDVKPDNVMVSPSGEVRLIDLGAVRRFGDEASDTYGTEGFLPPPEDGQRVPSVALDVYAAGRTLAALLLDFDSTGVFAHSLPVAGQVNRVVQPEEIGLGGDGELIGDVRFAGPSGEPLPPWLRLSHARDRRGRPVAVLHGNAPPGFVALRLVATPPGGGREVALEVSDPLADPGIAALLARATHPDPEGRFRSAEEMSLQVRGLIRTRLGGDPLPAVAFRSFGDMPVLPPALPGDAAKDWLPLPLFPESSGEEAAHVARAVRLDGVEARLSALRAVAAEPSSLGRSPEVFARLIEEVADEGEMGRILRQSVLLDPWDWRSAWSEARWLLSRGMNAAALRCLVRVFDSLPGEPVPRAAIGLCLALAGDHAEARRWYGTAFAAGGAGNPGLSLLDDLSAAAAGEREPWEAMRRRIRAERPGQLGLFERHLAALAMDGSPLAGPHARVNAHAALAILRGSKPASADVDATALWRSAVSRLGLPEAELLLEDPPPMILLRGGLLGLLDRLAGIARGIFR